MKPARFGRWASEPSMARSMGRPTVRSSRLLAALPFLLLPLLLAGCLEVEQHPPWREGQYDGKTDTLPQKTHYANDRMAWNAAIINRNHRQNEYRRMP